MFGNFKFPFIHKFSNEGSQNRHSQSSCVHFLWRRYNAKLRRYFEFPILVWPLLCQTSKATNKSRPHIWFSWVKRRFIDACRKQLDHGEFHQVRCWKFVATRVTKTDVGLSHVRWTRTIRNCFRGWSCGGYGGKNTGRGTPALWRHSSVRRAWRLQVG